MRPEVKLILRTARSLRRDIPSLNVRQAIGMATRMIEIVQGHMEDILKERK